MDQQVHQTIAAIYDSALSPGKWRHALDRIGDLAGAKAAALVIRDDPFGARNKTLLSSPYLEFSRTLRGMYYGAVLERHQNADWDRLSRHAPLQPVADHEAGQPVQNFDARPDYRSLTRNLGVTRRLGVRLNDDRVWFDAVSFGFAQKEPVAPAVWQGAIDLFPHVARAVEMSRIFFRLQRAYNAALAALDHVDVALLIARSDGQILASNARADALLASGTGLRKTTSNRLTTGQSDIDGALSAAITAATSTAAGAGVESRRTVQVDQAGGDHPLLVDISPLRDSRAELENGLVGALIMVIDPSDAPEIDISRFALAYGLTQAEADVCAAFARGGSTGQIAEERNTTQVTVKNQIASILSKTGCSGRADLLRLVLRVLPPVR